MTNGDSAVSYASSGHVSRVALFARSCAGIGAGFAGLVLGVALAGPVLELWIAPRTSAEDFLSGAVVVRALVSHWIGLLIAFSVLGALLPTPMEGRWLSRAAAANPLSMGLAGLALIASFGGAPTEYVSAAAWYGVTFVGPVVALGAMAAGATLRRRFASGQS